MKKTSAGSLLKRLLDIVLTVIGLTISSPILIPVLVAVWLQDFHSPFYIAPRVGRDGILFKMVKIRSMVTNADRTGVDSTSAKDPRITPVGQFVRRFKLDELAQLWNVLKGDMSLVGPRPNVKREVDIYTAEERQLLMVKPGITDIASIVFSDENDILKDCPDPDISYNQLIRPWKSRLGLLYIANHSLMLDLNLIVLTALALLSRQQALVKVQQLLDNLGAEDQLKQACRRTAPLKPFPPPGATEIVTHR